MKTTVMVALMVSVTILIPWGGMTDPAAHAEASLRYGCPARK
ncbi:MAG: hypothetical protein SWQ30_17770 [Thermodesulfobacteriota bacterium]|nr:hypothetical protein [Thermodesulfobacteriota bacterium]